MKTKPQTMPSAAKRKRLVLDQRRHSVVKTDETWEPAMPPRDKNGYYPIEVLDIIMAQEILRARRKLGLTQKELAKFARVRVATLDEIEHGNIGRHERALAKIDRALKAAQKRNGNHRAK